MGDKGIDVIKDRQTDKGWTDRQMDGNTVRWRFRQTDEWIYRQKCKQKTVKRRNRIMEKDKLLDR